LKSNIEWEIDMNRAHLLASLALLLLSATVSFAQQEGGPGGQGGPPPDFNPQAMRQRMMERMRERLGATADEWKVLSPRVEKVMSTQRDLRGVGGAGGFGGGPRPQGQGGPRGDGGDRGPRQARGGGDPPAGRGGPPQDRGPGAGSGGPPPQDQPQQQQPSPVAQTRQNLREAVDDSNVSADELAKLVKAYRDARDQGKDNLAKAQKELKELVTPRQEAFFVSMGLLD
jgi:hypothetical protein